MSSLNRRRPGANLLTDKSNFSAWELHHVGHTSYILQMFDLCLVGFPRAFVDPTPRNCDLLAWRKCFYSKDYSTNQLPGLILWAHFKDLSCHRGRSKFPFLLNETNEMYVCCIFFSFMQLHVSVLGDHSQGVHCYRVHQCNAPRGNQVVNSPYYHAVHTRVPT